MGVPAPLPKTRTPEMEREYIVVLGAFLTAGDTLLKNGPALEAAEAANNRWKISHHCSMRARVLVFTT